MNKTKAIKLARANYYVSFHSKQENNNSYIVRAWDEDCKAWREGYPRNYFLAVQLCCEFKLNYARRLLDKEPLPFENYRGERWESFV